MSYGMLHTLKKQFTINDLQSSVICWLPLQTTWTEIGPDKMIGLIWIQTVWQYSLKSFIKAVDFETSLAYYRKHAKNIWVNI